MKTSTVKDYMKAGKNIMISGPAGTGKTYVLNEVANNLGLKLKYYSASTLDAQADLLGIPVPNSDNTALNYIRPMDIEEAEVIFFDEANRADDRTEAAMFEITQFHTVNGKSLPNLKSVCIAINPNEDGYNVRELDTAFVDRFDVYLNAEPEFNYNYFSKKFDSEVAKNAKSWWEDYNNSYKISINKASNNGQVYISPRRMDKMLEMHREFKTKSSLRDSLPIGATANIGKLHAILMAIYNGDKVNKNTANEIQSIINLSNTEKRRDEMADRVMNLINREDIDQKDKSLLIQDISLAISSDVGVSRLTTFWITFIAILPDSVYRTMSHYWNKQKKNTVENRVRIYKETRRKKEVIS